MLMVGNGLALAVAVIDFHLLKRIAFDMGRMTRLAGACPLDGNAGVALSGCSAPT